MHTSLPLLLFSVSHTLLVVGFAQVNLFRKDLIGGVTTKKHSKWGFAQSRIVSLGKTPEDELILAWSKVGKDGRAVPGQAPSALYLRDVQAVTLGLAIQSPLYKKKAKTPKNALFVSVV